MQIPWGANTSQNCPKGCFGLSAAINGPWLERNGPKLTAVLGATLFFVGNMIAAVGIYSKVYSLYFFPTLNQAFFIAWRLTSSLS